MTMQCARCLSTFKLVRFGCQFCAGRSVEKIQLVTPAGPYWRVKVY